MITSEDVITVTTTRHVRRTISRNLLLSILQLHAMRSRRLVPPDNATITIRVPGGGDWSNTDMKLGVDTDALVVSWDITDTTTPEEK